MENCLMEAISVLNEITNTQAISKNIKVMAASVISILEEECDIAVKCDKAIQTLTVCDDNNIDMFTKTRIWSLLSILESVS